MGRILLKRRTRRQRRAVKREEYEIMTVDELSESVRRCSLEQLDPDVVPPQNLENDDGWYGTWLVSKGVERPGWQRQSARELMLKLKDAPDPDIFRPPLRLGGKNYSGGGSLRLIWRSRASSHCWPSLNHKIFEDVMSLVQRRSQQARERASSKAQAAPEPPCEGAVGYDRRYYECCMLVRIKGSVEPRKREDRTWFGGKYAVQLSGEPALDYQRLRSFRSRNIRLGLLSNKLAAGRRRPPSDRLKGRRLLEPTDTANDSICVEDKEDLQGVDDIDNEDELFKLIDADIELDSDSDEEVELDDEDDNVDGEFEAEFIKVESPEEMTELFDTIQVPKLELQEVGGKLELVGRCQSEPLLRSTSDRQPRSASWEQQRQ